MARPLAYLLTLALAALAATALSACGDEDAELLPGGTAGEITANLDTVKQLADEGDCLGAESAAQQVSEQVEALGGIDKRLKRALDEGATRLNEVVAECEEPEESHAPAEVPLTEEEEEPEKAPKKEKGKDRKDRKEEETEPTEPNTPTETTPTEPPAEPAPPPPSEEGGTPSGGVSPGSPVDEDDD